MNAWLSSATAQLAVMWADPVQRVAVIAAAAGSLLVMASSLSRTIVPLRWLLFGGSLAFVVYGWLKPAPLVLALHVLLLPAHLWRALQVHRVTRRISRAGQMEPLAVMVAAQPYMKRKRIAAGQTLFSRGDAADRLYVLEKGRLEVVETAGFIEAGEMFGEISFFSPHGSRTTTLRAAQPSSVLSIDEVTFRQLYFQNPEFGLEIVRLVTARLSADVLRLEARLAEANTQALQPPRVPPRP